MIKRRDKIEFDDLMKTKKYVLNIDKNGTILNI